MHWIMYAPVDYEILYCLYTFVLPSKSLWCIIGDLHAAMAWV